MSCALCGQTHPAGPHVYDFVLDEDIDDDMCCSICLSPFVAPTDLPCCHTYCRACILPFLRNKPYCPQCRTSAHVHQLRDSSLALRRLCDKLKVKCPKCINYTTERSLLSDHLAKCGQKEPDQEDTNRGRSVKHHRNHAGRSKSRDALQNPKKSPIKWHRSRDGLDRVGRSRSRERGLDHYHRSHSRDALVDHHSTEHHNVDLAREIERDIERINLYQDASASARRHRSIPTTSNNHNHSNPDLNAAVIINPSDLSSENASSDEQHQNQRNYFTVPASHSNGGGGGARVIDLQIPMEDKLDGISGLSLVGGVDTPLKGIFVQSIHPDCSAYTKSLIRPGDRVKRIQGRQLDQLQHAEAITLFGKMSRNSRQLDLQIERQTGFEIEQQMHIVLNKSPGQQVGIKLVTQQSQVRIYSVVTGSLAYNDGRLRNGDVLLRVSNNQVRSSDEAAREIGRVKGDTQIQLHISRVAVSAISAQSERPHLIIPDAQSTRAKSTIASKWSEKVIHLKKQLGESLGLGIAGGLGSLFGDLPVFVLDIKPNSRVAHDGKIKKGDLLVSINRKPVTGLRHSQVVEMLKDVARRETDIKIVVCEFYYKHRDHEDRLSFQPKSPSFCTWRHWLALPPSFLVYRETGLTRESGQPLGLSIVGGDGEPVMVKYCTPGSISSVSHLRSGDELLSINGTRVLSRSQAEIKQLLASPTIRIVFLSWPGCLV